jgi:hypothetical protein
MERPSSKRSLKWSSESNEEMYCSLLLYTLYMLLLLYSLFFCVFSSFTFSLFLQNSDAMISTPTGKFGQLISKIFMNVDKLLPALYGGVLSTILNLLVGVILLGIFFGPISFVLIVLYIAFTIAAYRAARQTGA